MRATFKLHTAEVFQTLEAWHPSALRFANGVSLFTLNPCVYALRQGGSVMDIRPKDAFCAVASVSLGWGSVMENTTAPTHVLRLVQGETVPLPYQFELSASVAPDAGREVAHSGVLTWDQIQKGIPGRLGVELLKQLVRATSPVSARLSVVFGTDLLPVLVYKRLTSPSPQLRSPGILELLQDGSKGFVAAAHQGNLFEVSVDNEAHARALRAALQEQARRAKTTAPVPKTAAPQGAELVLPPAATTPPNLEPLAHDLGSFVNALPLGPGISTSAVVMQAVAGAAALGAASVERAHTPAASPVPPVVGDATDETSLEDDLGATAFISNYVPPAAVLPFNPGSFAPRPGSNEVDVEAGETELIPRGQIFTNAVPFTTTAAPALDIDAYARLMAEIRVYGESDAILARHGLTSGDDKQTLQRSYVDLFRSNAHLLEQFTASLNTHLVRLKGGGQ